ncbi:hypothetical protein ACLB6G_15950 [Zhengella sp. ZM62]|uniref:hypothetical protein n=1 Tax=Zhengella sedimenti TaxID=3390035 RepID=UPI0039751EC7
MKNALKVLAAVAFIAPVQAYSATGNIPFNGSVTDTCVITVGSAGTIMPNTAYTVLSSKEAGGAAGTATILATGNGYSVSADAPSAWSAAPASTPATTFAAEYDLSGANSATNVSGNTQTAISHGSTSVNIDLTASLPSGTYESGTYAATVVLRCE